MHMPATAPGGPVTTSGLRAATIRVINAYRRPSAEAPTDGTGAPPAAAPAAVPAAAPPAADPLGVGGTPPAAPPGAPPAAPPPAAVPPAFTPPAAPPAAPPAGQPGAPPAAGGVPPAAAGDRPLDQFPPEIRDYIAELRKEAGDNRVKAKTAEDKAAGQMRAWLDGIAKTFGLVQDDPAVPPEQQIQQLTQQLSGAQDGHRATQVELAIWKNGADLGANPQRLTDSRAFMSRIDKLDPGASDFEQQLAAAIGTAVADQEYYRATPPAGQVPPATPPTPPAGQVPPAVPPAPGLPPVPSGGDFAGGTGSGATEPQTVDQFRAALREHRNASR